MNSCGLQLKIERIYNSKSAFKGMFGWGWGTEYEVYLTVEGDGSVVVHEYGGGADNVFTPPHLNARDLHQAIEVILTAAERQDPRLSGMRRADYEHKLASDRSFRHDEWDRLVAAKALAPRQLAVGTRLSSLRFNLQYVERTVAGYRRIFEDGRIEEFNQSGKHIRIFDTNHNWLGLIYDVNGRLIGIVDNFGQIIRLSYNAQGLVESVETGDGRKATYKYNPQSELVYSRDAVGNEFAYQYDVSGRHNLVAIAYRDGKTMAITYLPIQQHENVWSVKDRDGALSTYGYDIQTRGSNSGDQTYKVSAQVRDTSGNVIGNSSYRYISKTKPDGEQWTYELTQVIDGDETDTIYDENSGLALVEKTGQGITTYKYDDDGHLLQTDTPSEVTYREYEDLFGKVSEVETCSKLDVSNCLRSDYVYDAKGNLIRATWAPTDKNQPEKTISLAYDDHGLITTMAEGDQVISFEYKSSCHPSRVGVRGLGALEITYNKDGGVRSVKAIGQGVTPAKSPEMAQRIQSVFRDLEEVLGQGKVNISLWRVP